MFDWLTRSLETIDQQAAISASERTIVSIDDDVEGSTPSLELSALRANLRRSNATIASLEEKLSALEQSKAHYENELRQSESRTDQLSHERQELNLELNRLQTALQTSERKHLQESAASESIRRSYEEMRDRMQNEISALSQELSSTQRELSVTSHDLDKLRSEHLIARDDIRKLEDEIAQYRDLAVKELKIDTHDRTVLAQLEVLESERNRLKDSLSKCQQRIGQLDATAREHEERMLREMRDAKQQHSMLEMDLVRSRTQVEAMSQEIALLRGELSTSQEAVESRYKAQIAAVRNEHKAEIARVRSQAANGTKNGHSVDEQLLNALAMVDALKSEKAALLVRLHSHGSGGESGLMMNVNVDGRVEKAKYVPLGTCVGKGGIRRMLARTERVFRNALDWFARRPIARTALVIWIVVLHVIWVVGIFM
jgi:peptidoglycan hydrolase CwlO-like protein